MNFSVKFPVAFFPKFRKRKMILHKGPFIFYEIGGAGGIEGGAMKKKLVLKGGPSKKISSVRGGHSKNYPKIL